MTTTRMAPSVRETRLMEKRDLNKNLICIRRLHAESDRAVRRRPL
jgi:hypothetical protein